MYRGRELRERLPTRVGDDPFDQLAASVNRMLGKIETLIHEVSDVSQNIAHDLRTPLARLRLRLERGREHAETREELQAVVDQAIGDLDQSLTTITALLVLPTLSIAAGLTAFVSSGSRHCCGK